MSNETRNSFQGKVRQRGSSITDNPDSSFYGAVNALLLGRISDRSQAIIRARFGLDDQPAKTLENIGKKYDITRERVRQIIRGVVKDIEEAESGTAIKRVEAIVLSTLKKHHGIMTEEALYAELSQGDVKESGALRFFVENFLSLQEVKESRISLQAFALPEFSLSLWKAIIEKASSILEKENRPLASDEFRQAIVADAQFSKNGEEFFDFLAVAREIKQSVFGVWGFVKWSDIEPRGAREKAYLVLKAEKKPLHFREIATLIDSYSLQKRGRKTHYQTVHNELIKDKRFVLVGRGIYALSEWGYVSGTVKEILTRILKEAGQPLERKDILNRITSLRQVKRSTVIINLNTFFARVGKSAYTLKK